MTLINSLIVLTSLVPAAEETYSLVEAQSYLYVELKPGGLLSAASHAHVVRATEWRGQVRWDPSAPERCAIEIVIPVSGLVVDEPQMRKRLALKKAISEGDRRQVRENMLDEGQLDAKKFGSIRFTSTGCKKAGANRIDVIGDFEIRGVKKRVTVPMKVRFKGDRFQALGRFVLKHQDFGFEPYSAALGAISNDEALTFHVRAVGKR